MMVRAADMSLNTRDVIRRVEEFKNNPSRIQRVTFGLAGRVVAVVPFALILHTEFVCRTAYACLLLVQQIFAWSKADWSGPKKEFKAAFAAINVAFQLWTGKVRIQEEPLTVEPRVVTHTEVQTVPQPVAPLPPSERAMLVKRKNNEGKEIQEVIKWGLCQSPATELPGAEGLITSFILKVGQEEYSCQLFAIFEPVHNAQGAPYLKEHLQAVLEEELKSYNQETLSTKRIELALRSTLARLSKPFPSPTLDNPKQRIYQDATMSFYLLLDNNVWPGHLSNSGAGMNQALCGRRTASGHKNRNQLPPDCPLWLTSLEIQKRVGKTAIDQTLHERLEPGQLAYKIIEMAGEKGPLSHSCIFIHTKLPHIESLEEVWHLCDPISSAGSSPVFVNTPGSQSGYSSDDLNLNLSDLANRLGGNQRRPFPAVKEQKAPPVSSTLRPASASSTPRPVQILTITELATPPGLDSPLGTAAKPLESAKERGDLQLTDGNPLPVSSDPLSEGVEEKVLSVRSGLVTPHDEAILVNAEAATNRSTASRQKVLSAHSGLGTSEHDKPVPLSAANAKGSGDGTDRSTTASGRRVRFPRSRKGTPRPEPVLVRARGPGGGTNRSTASKQVLSPHSEPTIPDDEGVFVSAQGAGSGTNRSTASNRKGLSLPRDGVALVSPIAARSATARSTENWDVVSARSIHHGTSPHHKPVQPSVIDAAELLPPLFPPLHHRGPTHQQSTGTETARSEMSNISGFSSSSSLYEEAKGTTKKKES